MGITYARDPATGLLQAINISGDTPSQSEIQRINDWQLSRAPVSTPVAAPEEEYNPPGTALGRAFQSGLGQFQQLGGEALEGVGIDGLGQYLREAGVARQQEVDQYRTRMGDVEGVGTGLLYAGELAAEQAPVMAPTIFGSLAGGAVGGALAGSAAPGVGTAIGAVVGGALASYPLLFGGNRAEQRQADIEAGRPVEIDDATAALAAIPQAALEGIAGKIVALGFRPVGGTGMLTRVVKGAAEGVAAEVPTEIGQEVIQIAQAGGDITSEAAIKRYIEAGVAAGVLGGGLGGISGGIRAPETMDTAYETPVGAQQYEEDRKLEDVETKERIEGAEAARQRAVMEAVSPTQETPLLSRPAPTPQPGPAELPAGESSIELPANQPLQDRAQRDAADAALRKRQLEAVQKQRAQHKREVADRAIRLEEAGGEIPFGQSARRNVQSATQLAVAEEQTQRAAETRQARAQKGMTKAVTPTAVTKSDLKRVAKNKAQADYGWDKQVWSYTAPDGKEYVAFKEEQGGSTIPARSWGIYERDAGVSSAVYAGENLDGVADFLRREQTGAVPDVEARPAPEPRIEDDADPAMREALAEDRFLVDQIGADGEVTGTREATREELRQEGWRDDAINLFPRADQRQSAQRTIPRRSPQPEPTAEQNARPVEKGGSYIGTGRLQPAPFSPEVKQRIDAIGQALRKALDDRGLKDVGLRVAEVLNPERLQAGALDEGYETSPSALRSVINIATEVFGKDASPEQIVAGTREVLSHEMIHALRTLGLFTDAEWTSLVAASKKTKYVRPDGTKREYSYHYRRRNLQIEEALAENGGDMARARLEADALADMINEEAVADMFRDWAAGRLKIGGKPQTLFKRIMSALRGIYSAAKSQDVESAADIFNLIEGGEIGSRERGRGAARPVAPTPENIAEIRRHSAKVMRTQAFRDWAAQEDGLTTARNEDGSPAVIYRGVVFDEAVPGDLEAMAYFKHNKGYPAIFGATNPNSANTYGAIDGDDIYKEMNMVRGGPLGTGPVPRRRAMILPFFARGKITDITEIAVNPADLREAREAGFPPTFNWNAIDRQIKNGNGPKSGEIWVLRNVADPGARLDDTTPGMEEMYRSAEDDPGDIYILGPNTDIRPVYSFRDEDVTPSDTGTPAQRFSSLRQRASTAERALSKADPQRSNIAVEAVRAAHRLLPMISDPDQPVSPERPMAILRALRGRLSSGDLDNLGGAEEYLQDYADIQAKVPVHNAMQWRARAIPLAIAEGNTVAALKHTNDLINSNLGEARYYQEGFDQTQRYSSLRRLPLTSAAKLQLNPLVIEGTGPGGRILKQDYAKVLTQRHMDMHGRKFDPANSEQDFANVAEAMRDEYREQQGQHDDGLGWYTADVARAIGITESIIPAISNPVKRDILMLNAALTSPQERPFQNWEKAVELTERYLEEGKLPLAKLNGKSWGLGDSNIRLLQFLIDRFGESGAVQFAQQMHSGRDIAMLRKESGLFNPQDPDKLASYKAAEVGLGGETLGVYMFGPKVGDFFLNISGIDPAAVTVDIWAGQNFNRHIGRLMDVGPKALAQGKIAADPRGVGERNVIKSLYRDLAEREGIDPSAAQAALWYFEQRLERSHGINAPSQNFSEAAELAARKRGIVPAIDPVEGIEGVRAEAGVQRIETGARSEQGRSGTVLRSDGTVEKPKVVSSPRYSSRRLAKASDPVTETDLYNLNEDFFRRPGWGVVTANRPNNLDYGTDERRAVNPALIELENRRRSNNFREYLDYMGLPYREVTGFYKGNDEGLSFLVIADEATMIKLGQQNQQESIITSSGLIYTNMKAADTPATGEVFMDDAARAQEGYTEVGENAFSLGLNWDIGPGIAQVPENFYFHVDRPQLPINRETGMAELHHFSDKRLETIDPKYSGTGTLVGPERRMGWEVNFYGVNPRKNYREPGTGYVKEDQRWKYDHVVEVDPKDLYPWYENPDEIETGNSQSDYHRNIKEAGYKGYYVTDDGSNRAPLGNVAVLYEAMPVKNVKEDIRASSRRLSSARTGPGTGNGMGATVLPAGAPQLSYSADQRLLTQGNGMQYTRAAKAVERTLGIVFRTVGKEERAKEYAREYIQKFQDAMLPFGEMMDELRAAGLDIRDVHDVYMQEELMHGRLGAMLGEAEESLYKPFAQAVGDTDLTPEQVRQMREVGDRAVNGTSYLSNAIDTYRAEERRGLLTKIKESRFVKMYHSDKVAIADAYLYAKHAKSRNAYVRRIRPDNDAGSGMTDAEADAIIGFVNSLPQAQRAKFERISNIRSSIIGNTNQLRKQKYGLVAEDVESGMTDYVPLRGKMDPDGFIEDSIGPSVGTPTIGARGREDRQVTGRKDYATSSIVAELIAQNQRTISRGERNDVGKSLLGLLRENPQLTNKFAEEVGAPRQEVVVDGKVRSVPKAFYDPAEQVLTVKEDGKNRYIKLKDHRLGRAIGISMNPQVPSAIIRKIGSFNRYLANVNTSWNIEFLISNAWRDIETALVNAGQYEIEGVSRDILKGIRKSFQGVQAVIRKKNITDPEVAEFAEAFREFQKLGGQNVTNMVGNLENIEGRLRGIMADINEGDRTRSANMIRNAFIGKNGLGTLLADYNTVVENMTRLSFYKAMRDRGVAPERAAQAARNLTTNFAKGGEWKNGVNAMYLFYNASLQGSWALLRALTRSKKVRKMWAGVVGLGVAMDLMNAAMSGEDDDGELIYDKIYDYDLEHNIILMDPFGMTDRGYFKFPMAYGLNMAMNIGRVSSRTLRGGYDAEDAAASALGTVIETVWPFGGQESIGNAIAPTVLDPVVDIYENENFAKQPIYKDAPTYGAAEPSGYRHFTTTGRAYVGATKFLNDITGGNEIREGWVSWNPDILEYFVEYATGATGATIARAGGTLWSLQDIATGQAEEEFVRQVPLARRLFSTVTEKQDVAKFFKKSAEVDTARRELKRAIELGDTEWAAEVRRKYPDELKVAGAIQQITNARNKVKKLMRDIESNPRMSDEQKRKTLDQLKERLQMIVARGNELMRDI